MTVDKSPDLLMLQTVAFDNPTAQHLAEWDRQTVTRYTRYIDHFRTTSPDKWQEAIDNLREIHEIAMTSPVVRMHYTPRIRQIVDEYLASSS